MISAILFDFDGTVSTLRRGWESIMKPFMLEELGDASRETEREVDDYIDASTGIQTIEQMQWLRERVAKTGAQPKAVLEYKAIYNERILALVKSRQAAIERGEARREAFLVKGADDFLRRLCDMRLRLLVASGTDHPDLCAEIEYLGLTRCFESVKGAPVNEFVCSKERVLRDLVARLDLYLAGR